MGGEGTNDPTMGFIVVGGTGETPHFRLISTARCRCRAAICLSFPPPVSPTAFAAHLTRSIKTEILLFYEGMRDRAQPGNYSSPRPRSGALRASNKV